MSDTEKTKQVTALCDRAFAEHSHGHYAGDDRYWAVGRGWRWLINVSTCMRQCEVGAVAGDRHLCCLAMRYGVVLPYDPECALCRRRRSEEEHRRRWHTHDRHVGGTQ
jgi:hypothetical protein